MLMSIPGNGLTDFYTMMEGYYKVACTPVSVSPAVLSIASCVRMKHVVRHFRRLPHP